MKIGILGNGSVGSKLAVLCAGSGHEVRIGVRRPAESAPGAIQLLPMREAAAQSDLVLLAVPYSACAALLAELAPG